MVTELLLLAHPPDCRTVENSDIFENDKCSNHDLHFFFHNSFFLLTWFFSFSSLAFFFLLKGFQSISLEHRGFDGLPLWGHSV